MRATGIDISYAQATYKPQPWHSFVMIRATYGKRTDKRFIQHLDSTKAEQRIIATHYLKSPDINSIDEQVDTLANLIRGLDISAVACDFEKYYNTKSKDFALGAEKFCKGISDKLGMKCLLYSSPSVIQEWMYPYGLYWARDYEDLWIAQWPYNGWNESLTQIPSGLYGWEPRLPAGVNTWKYWQYSGEHNIQGSVQGVSSRDCDLNVFNGTREEMDKWFGLSVSQSIEDTWYKKGWNAAAKVANEAWTKN